MNVALADANVLIALTVLDHVHHGPARSWFAGHAGGIATCPITEGALLRFLLRSGISTYDAISTLEEIRKLPQHTFWPDEIHYVASMLVGVIGHRQVTDAYLVALAAHFGGSLVTLDKGLAALHPAKVELIPT